MATAGDLVGQARNEVGFDASEAQVLVWLNDRHGRMISESLWLRKSLEVDTTTADQAFYVTPTSIVELLELTVNGLGYTKARRQDMIAGRLGRLSLSGTGGVFIPDADMTGAAGVTLYPTPGEDGLSIVAFAAVRPDDLELADSPLVPPEFFSALVDGVVATGMARDAGQIAAADRFEARFDAAVEKLRRLGKRQLRGGGPRQIRVAGVNA